MVFNFDGGGAGGNFKVKILDKPCVICLTSETSWLLHNVTVAIPQTTLFVFLKNLILVQIP